jgi:hypothetical protein
MVSKRAKWWLTAGAAVLLMAATVPVAIWVTHTQSAQLENTRQRCEGKKQIVHTVIVKGDTVSPVHTEARQCDSLTITNLDDKERLVAFGKHDSHISYDGVSERVLGRGQSLTVSLGQAGTFLFHDHAQDSVKGTFTVTRPK